MVINRNNTPVIIRRPHTGVSENEMTAIEEYLKGAVRTFCATKANEPFSARTLVGGENANWNGTILQKLYEYRNNAESSNPIQAAAQDLGWILLKVLQEDEIHIYEKFRSGQVATYRRIH